MTSNTSDIEQYLDLIEVIIVVIDSRQNVIYINKQGCEILGRERGDIIGKNWFDNFLPEKISNDIKTVYSKLMAGEIELAKHFDNVVLTKAGQERIIGWHNTAIKDGTGAIIGTLSWGEDITERKRNDKIKDDLIQELQSRVSELKSMKMKIPMCSWNKEDVKDAIEKHYHQISIDGKCSECLHVLRMLSKAKE